MKPVQPLFVCIGLLFIIIVGCAPKTGLVKTEPGIQPVLVPAGVDSSIAIQADSVAKSLFVSAEREESAQILAQKAQNEKQKGDTLWQALKAEFDSMIVSSEDSIKSIDKFNTGALQLLSIQQLQNNEEIEGHEKEKQLLEHLLEAQNAFEKAIILNPFDQQSRQWLGTVYQGLGERFSDNLQMHKAIEVYEKLALLNQDQHVIFATIANCYYAIEKWNAALQNMQKAEQILLDTAIFNTPDSVSLDSNYISYIDSTSLYTYVYYQGDLYTNLYNADGALAAFKKAQTLTHSEDDLLQIESQINWILWDDGNISASEKRDSVFEMIAYEEYEQASQEMTQMLKKLNTQRASREIKWRLATLQFQFLEKKDIALNTMQEVVAFYKQNNLQLSISDTLHNHYRNTYGTMLYNRGIEVMNHKKYKNALTYFKQSASIEWNEQGRAHFEILKLSRNNPMMSVNTGLDVMKYIDQLKPQERRLAYKYLISALKRSGRIEEAVKWFREYKLLAAAVKNSKG